MAATKLTSRAQKKNVTVSKWQIPLHKSNMIVFGIGAAVILVGFLLMTTAITSNEAEYAAKWNNDMAVVIAPILLVIGYCVIIPYAIMKKPTEQSQIAE